MYLVFGAAELHIPAAQSLKDKRQVIQSLVQRMRKRFDVSIREVKYQETWQRSILGFAAVCSTAAEADIIAEMIKNCIDTSNHELELIDFWHELQRPDR